MAASGASRPARAVLVTRPAGEAADALCAALHDAGFAPRALPLMQLHALPELTPASRRMAQDLDNYQHVIFISANAVRFGLDVLENYWPQWPQGLHWYAVGAATAALLARHGIDATTPGAAMTSEGLLALPGLAQVAGARVLIVKGAGGRETLARELRARGAAVDELACYARAAPDLAPGELAARLAAWRIDTILLSSGEGLENLLALLSPAETTKVKRLCVIVPSERVAMRARAAGFARVVTAANASDAAMLHALQDREPANGD